MTVLISCKYGVIINPALNGTHLRSPLPNVFYEPPCRFRAVRTALHRKWGITCVLTSSG